MITASLGWCAAAWALDAYGRRPLDENQRWDAAVVAGCRVMPGGHASTALARRCQRAVQLWHQGKVTSIICTGGVGDHPPSEASVAAAMARDLGVPSEAIFLEDRSTTTEENARFAAALYGDKIKSVLVVSDSFHVLRCQRVFNRHFAHAHGTGSINDLSPRLRGALREVAAVAWYAAHRRL